MMRNCLFVAALLSLALAGGCAKGGNGIPPLQPSVTVSITTPKDYSASDIYPTQTVTLAAATTDPNYAPVTWSLSGPGTITSTTPPTATASATATYQAPTTAGSQPTVTATLTSDTSITGPLPMTIVDITTDVAPTSLSIGKGLTQQFAAVAEPDGAPQTFTWTCTANGVPCANFVQDSNVPGLAYYTAQDNCGSGCVQISAAAPLDPTGCSTTPKNCTIAKASLVTSRVSGTYAFQFSGYDGTGSPVWVAGTFTTGATTNGVTAIASGWEDLLTASGPSAQNPNPIQITGGSYTPTSSDPNNSNNAGTLTLTLPSGVYPNQYQVVLDGAGDLEMIESDIKGSGSGIAQKSASSSLFTGDQTYAFGFTGVDLGGNRVGYVGVLPMNGSAVVGGQMDVNDNGATNTVCASPCSVAGPYSADANIAGLWHMTLTAGTTTLDFDFFISSGTASKTTPLTFYAISTDPVDATHPAVSGTMVLQDSSQTYNIAAFNGASVSALTGTVMAANATCTAPPCANVSLTLGSTDGNGNFSGQFDQNNAGTILSSAAFPPTSGTNNYTYAASGTNGRYTFNMLGNPTATSGGAPLPFVLYASGANRGFLLDQNSPSVMTGTMNPQGNGSGIFSSSELPGTYAAATTSTGSSAVSPVAANLLVTLLTPPAGAETFNISGTEYPGSQTITGTYDLAVPSRENGTGTIALTAPATQNYVIYVLGTSGPCNLTSPVCAIQSFLMIDEDKTNPNASIIFAKE
jgi:hypothetical protein